MPLNKKTNKLKPEKFFIQIEKGANQNFLFKKRISKSISFKIISSFINLFINENLTETEV